MAKHTPTHCRCERPINSELWIIVSTVLLGAFNSTVVRFCSATCCPRQVLQLSRCCVLLELAWLAQQLLQSRLPHLELVKVMNLKVKEGRRRDKSINANSMAHSFTRGALLILTARLETQPIKLILEACDQNCEALSRASYTHPRAWTVRLEL